MTGTTELALACTPSLSSSARSSARIRARGAGAVAPPPPFVCALPVLNVVVWRAQVEEVAQFGQDDLLDDDVMMLDVGTAVYLWVGSGANAEEKTKAICALCWRYFHTPQMASNFSAADH